MMKQILNDFVHMTQMEFLLAHPLVIGCILAVGLIALYVAMRIKNKKTK